jgi:O-methyltransferase domain/Dimerisation domain
MSTASDPPWVVSPAATLPRRLLEGVAATQLIGAAARHGVADLIDAGPLTADEIAARTGTHAGAMFRVLRALVALGLFTLDDDGRFGNNELSESLRSESFPNNRYYAAFAAQAWHYATWSSLEHTLQTGESAFEHAHGTSQWQWFEEHPDERETFARGLAGISAQYALLLAGLYPFDEIQRICDVGGGRGIVLSELLAHHPHLEGVLLELPGVVESARALLQRRGVIDRARLVGGDFFEEVPSDCDAYLLKHVLHNWDDADCRRILQVCREGMGAGEKLLIAELPFERHGDGFAAVLDVQMMVVASQGRERTVDEFESLLAPTGLRRDRVFSSHLLSVIEAVAI